MKTEAAKADYPEFLAKLKERILESRTMAVRAVNHELILLYWDIGQGIVQKQEMEGWGESVIDRLSADLKEAFPHSTGFSSRNLRDMKRFYLVYTDEAIWRQVVAKLDNSTSTKEEEKPKQLRYPRNSDLDPQLKCAARTNRTGAT